VGRLLVERLAALMGRNDREIIRFLKFATVGACGTLIDFAILNVLILGPGLAKVTANTASFSTAAFFNFVGNRLWSFPESREKPFLSQMVRFLLVSLGGYIINQALFLGLSRYAFGGLGPLGYNLAKAAATIVVLFWNYGVNRAWTYRGI